MQRACVRASIAKSNDEETGNIADGRRVKIMKIVPSTRSVVLCPGSGDMVGCFPRPIGQLVGRSECLFSSTTDTYNTYDTHNVGSQGYSLLEKGNFW